MLVYKFGFEDPKIPFKNEITTFNEDSIKHCQFSSLPKTKQLYTCHNFESCCENGCCVTIFKRISQYWYFWILILSLSIIVLLCTHYYKKARILRERQIIRSRHRRNLYDSEYYQQRVVYRPREEQHSTHQNIFADVYTQQNRENFTPFRSLEPHERTARPSEINNLLYEHLLASFIHPSRSQQSVAPNLPPEYSTLLKDTVYADPPGYVEACKLLKDNETQYSEKNTSQEVLEGNLSTVNISKQNNQENDDDDNTRDSKKCANEDNL